MTSGWPVLLVAAGVLSWLLVGRVRRYALAHDVLDLPGERSSHARPTPRGGGLGLVASWGGVVLFVAEFSGMLSARFAMALVAVGLTAWVGFRDDHGGLGVRPRLSAHSVAGLLIVPLAAGGPWWWASACWWWFWTVASINVWNFMDGIDGLIGSQALVFGVHLMLLGQSAGVAPASLVGVALAGAAAGFLAWNWAPARIFLGDVGSGSLGAIAALGGALLVRGARLPVPVVFLPLYPIFLDATMTLLRRAWRGEPLAVAHRSHLYQRLANEAGWGHARVAFAFGVAAALGALAARISTGPAGVAPVAVYLLVVPLAGWRLERSAHP